MADLVITPASVLGSTGANSSVPLAGEAIAQGQACYIKDADSKAWLAINTGTVEVAKVKGVALNCASPGQPVKLQSSGDLTPGAVLAVGQIYCLSSTAGGICPYGDLNTGDKVTVLGVAKTVAILPLTIYSSGVIKP